MHINSHKDAVAGVVFAAIGTVAFFYAHQYPIGTALNMGPGFFPALLGVILFVLGLGTFGRAMVTETDRLEVLAWRPMLLLPLGVLLFGLMIDRLGLIPSILVAIVLSRLAAPRLRILEVLAVCVVLTVLASVLFVYGLGLPPATLLPR
jgi:hypothetical protein